MSLGRIFYIYKNVLEKHTNKVQAVQTSFLLGLGDIISQKVIESEKKYDYKRTLRFSFMGLAIGPFLLKWYKTLDKLVGHEVNMKTVLKKVAVDQTLMSPIMVAAFLSGITILEGGKYKEVEAKMEENYFDILKSNYKLWPATQLITFRLPLNFRVLFVQFVALGWNTYLSWKINHEKVKI